jgi:phytoene dehydrogenase-like protein
MKEYAVIGSGIGGASIAAYLDAQGFDTVLFEKEPYLGGCASTFSHQGYRYNSGATTLAGYEEGHSVKAMFDTLGLKPKLIESNPGMLTIQNGVVLERHKDLERFLTSLDNAYPHPKNREFWTLVRDITEAFYTVEGYYYSNRSTVSKLRSLCSYLPILFKFKRYLIQNGEDFIKDFFGEISETYLNFLQAQLFIVAQARLKEVNFFTAAISLGYTFNTTHYVVGGMESLFELLSAKMKDVRRSQKVLKIEKCEGFYKVHTKEEIVEAKNIILNATIYDSAKYFDDPKITSYYRQYEKLNNYQSSFMVYMSIKSDKIFHHHYQIIDTENYPMSLSNAVFVSFSDASDTTIAPQGHYSITASIHTDLRWWQDKSRYIRNKTQLQELMIKKICDTLKIEETEIVHRFSATPRTFDRFINRSQLGGNAITMKNFLPKLPGNDTAFKGIYHVGDSVYPAQGWPGVMMGVHNLRKLLHV